MSKRSVQVAVDQERSQKKRAANPPEPKTKTATASRRGASAVYGREDKVTAEAQPSRKSSRRSANHQKAAPMLKARQELRLVAPTRRHDDGS